MDCRSKGKKKQKKNLTFKKNFCLFVLFFLLLYYTLSRVHQEAGIINRLSALEARAYRRAKLVQMLYLPLIFVVYGILLGTVYFQTHNPTFTLSAFGVFSCASGLFMFPAVYTYLFRAIEVRGCGEGCR